MKFSIIIPARDEQALIGACLDSVACAAQPCPHDVELIVVCNRCTDRTEEIARARGAGIVHEDARNLSCIRNAGARQARGDIIVTIDADSRMAAGTLRAIDTALASGRYIGGGVFVRPERRSLGIIVTELFLWIYLVVTGLGGGVYWCYRRDFEAIGGFNEAMCIGEDLDFARRLKAHGRASRRRFGTLWRVSITTSARKFDRFGDWYMLRILLLHPREALRAFRGEDQSLADRCFYDFDHAPAHSTEDDCDA